jgi:hypothetical protein
MGRIVTKSFQFFDHLLEGCMVIYPDLLAGSGEDIFGR